jgi:hypothetical protein
MVGGLEATVHEGGGSAISHDLLTSVEIAEKLYLT